LEEFKIPLKDIDRVALRNIARTSVSTKLHPKLANLLVDICVDAVTCIKKEG
jgi:chaperonin GroEL (HSP60 family)